MSKTIKFTPQTKNTNNQKRNDSYNRAQGKQELRSMYR